MGETLAWAEPRQPSASLLTPVPGRRQVAVAWAFQRQFPLDGTVAPEMAVTPLPAPAEPSSPCICCQAQTGEQQQQQQKSAILLLLQPLPPPLLPLAVLPLLLQATEQPSQLWLGSWPTRPLRGKAARVTRLCFCFCFCFCSKVSV